MIERADRGSEYEYRTHIDLTFHPSAPFNRTPVIDLRECRFVASVPGEAKGPWKMLHEEARPVSIHLAQEGDTAHLPDFTFRLSKSIAAKARRVGLAVDDGRLMWPMPVKLQ